jgi:hypothetical protein
MSKIGKLLEINLKEGIKVISRQNISYSQIKNFDKLPSEIKKEIINSNLIETSGFSELLGYSKGKVLFSIAGYWDDSGLNQVPISSQAKFTATSYGSNSWQWDGLNLKAVN